MNTIPFSEVVRIVPSVLSAGGKAVDLNGLVLTKNESAPYGSVLNFSTASDVKNYFGSSSDEASIASVYFKGFNGGTQVPGSLLFSRFPQADIAGFLRSGSLKALTLGDLQTLSGNLAITVAGTLETSGAIDFSGVTSFSNAATVIQSAFVATSFVVTYDSNFKSFVFTTDSTGATQTITFAGVDTLSTALKLTQTTGAVTSQGADATVPADFMDSLITSNQNWATFMTVWESDLAEKKAFANWSDAEQPRWLYVCHDSDINVLTANSTVTFGNYLQENQLIGSLAIYGNKTHSAFVCGFAASLNFDKLNGRSTLFGKSQSGLVPTINNATEFNAVKSNGYNCYGAYGSNNPANNDNWFSPGSVSGKWLWADTYLNQIWLNANIQLAMVKLLTSVTAIPYNAQGNGLIYSAALDPINSALNFGAIRTGIRLSEAQTSEIQYTLGFNASPTIESQGFYLQIGEATAQTRALRQSPPITLYYQDGEAVQQITMASIAIQ